MLTRDRMTSQMPASKGRLSTPVLVGCVNYFAGNEWRQIGFIYHMNEAIGDGQAVKAINVGRDVPLERLRLIKMPGSGNYTD